MQVQGIEISYNNLIYELILAIVPILVFIAGIIFAVIMLYAPDNRIKRKKTQNRIENLKKRAETDEKAAKELERVLRKQKNTKKRMKTYQLWILFGILFCIVLVDVIFLLVPICLDLMNDDYIVFEGEFFVARYYSRNATSRYNTYIGEECEGLKHGYEYVDNVGDYTGKVVYSHRSKIVVAIVDEVPIY